MKENLRKFLPYLKGQYRLLTLVLFCALIATSAKLAIPYLAGLSINALIDGDADIVSLYLMGIGICLALGTLFRYAFDYLTALLGQRVIKRLRQQVFESYQKASIAYLDQSRQGDLILRLINDVENVQSGLVSGFATLFDGVVAILLTLGFMASLNWALTLLVVFLTPISIFVSRKISSYNSAHFKSQAKAAGALTAFTLESLNNSETIQTLDLAEKRAADFDKLSDEYRKNTFQAVFGSSAINPATRMVNALINSALIACGALFVIYQAQLPYWPPLTLGALSAFLTYAANYMQPFNEVSDVVTEIDYAFASFARIDAAIHAPKAINEGRETLVGPVASIQGKAIHFSYDGSREILKGIDFSALKGKRIALVGPTGCGKTTLINLLLRFYEPDSGEITFNDVPIAELEKRGYRSHLGMVLQDTWIFSGTVYENIAYAKENATREEVIAAAKKAQADGFISRLPQGYDTPISDSSGLSLGEKQLLCVARVMLLNPEVVILDEATSNIDIRTEALLSSSFQSLMAGKTSFVVAHRLSTIVGSDTILVMKDGQIIESGSHSELMAKKGFYYSLYNAQFA